MFSRLPLLRQIVCGAVWRTNLRAAGIVCVATLLAPSLAHACACGCGVFGVGTLPLLPSGTGGTAFFEYDFMDQNRNWNGTSETPSSANPDKDIRTSFFTAGVQYMFNDAWGVMAEVPYWDRSFRTTDEATGNLVTFNHAAPGDIRLTGVYSGFSPDNSTGIIFGLKLPTGDSTYPGFDRDTEIGSGSTDTLLGAYHAGALVPDNAWGWFVQGMWEHAVAERGSYRPGDEFDAATGVAYARGIVLRNAAIMPAVELVASERLRDSGSAADPQNSGYARLFIAPGAELDFQAWKLYAAAEFPVYQHFNGDQLAARALFKVTIGYNF